MARRVSRRWADVGRVVRNERSRWSQRRIGKNGYPSIAVEMSGTGAYSIESAGCDEHDTATLVDLRDRYGRESRVRLLVCFACAVPNWVQGQLSRGCLEVRHLWVDSVGE